MHDAKPIAMPLDPSTKLEPTVAEDKPTDQTLFRQIISSTMYLMTDTRPDLAVAVSIVSQFATNLSQTYLQATKCILLYLKSTTNYMLCLSMNWNHNQDQVQARELAGPYLYGYSDIDWEGDVSMRKLTFRYVFFI